MSVLGMHARRHVVLERFGPPEVMAWEDGELPARGEGEVLIRVEAIGVNFADTMVRRGEYRRDQPLTMTPGFEVAGRVLAGPGVGSTVLVRASRVFRVADGVSAQQAAALFTQGVTALYAVQRYAQVGAGDTVLVHAGAGGLGGLCLQLCARLGARGIATASTAAKLAVARTHGAAETLLADPDTLAAGVRELTAGRGADIVIDGVGGPLFAPSLKALAFNGCYVVVGSASQEPATVDVRALMPRGQTIVGFVVARVADEDPAEPQAAFDEVQRLFLAGELTPQVTVMGPEDIHRAHHLIEGRTLTGKIVLDLT
jgi:NADPH2:quinone reductase